MTIIKKLIDFLWVIAHPKFWVMNYQYSKEWDEFMQEMLLSRTFTEIKDFTAKLNGIEVWISNYPYAAFTNYPNAHCRPARRTIAKLREKLIKDNITEKTKQI